MKKIIKIFCLFLILLSKSYANDDLVFDDNLKTIKELKHNIEELNINRSNLFNQKLDLNSNDELMSYFRTDLTRDELIILESIIDDYNKTKSFLEYELNQKSKRLEDTDNIKEDLIQVKKNLYQQMTPFIKISHYQDYLDHIRSDTQYFSQKTKIYSDILKKQEIVNSKLGVIEDRIREHKISLQDTLNEIIYKKIGEKIRNIENNPNFKNLDNNKKIGILEKTLDRLNSDLEKSLLMSDSKSVKKSDIYKIVIQELIDLRNSYIKKGEQ